MAPFELWFSDNFTTTNEALLDQGMLESDLADIRSERLLETKKIEMEISHSAKDILDLCRFQEFEDGSAQVLIPKEFSVVEIGKLANLACKAMKIALAFDQVEMERWGESRKDQNGGAKVGEHYIIRCEKELGGTSYEGQLLHLSQFGRKMAPAGAVLLAGLCKHLQSLGREDFTAGFELRTSDSNLIVKRGSSGLRLQRYYRLRFGVDNEHFVACASQDNTD